MVIKEIRDTDNKNIRLTITPLEIRVKFPKGCDVEKFEIEDYISELWKIYQEGGYQFTVRGVLELKYFASESKCDWFFHPKSNDRFLWRIIKESAKDKIRRING